MSYVFSSCVVIAIRNFTVQHGGLAEQRLADSDWQLCGWYLCRMFNIVVLSVTLIRWSSWWSLRCSGYPCASFDCTRLMTLLLLRIWLTQKHGQGRYHHSIQFIIQIIISREFSSLSCFICSQEIPSRHPGNLQPVVYQNETARHILLTRQLGIGSNSSVRHLSTIPKIVIEHYAYGIAGLDICLQSYRALTYHMWVISLPSHRFCKSG